MTTASITRTRRLRHAECFAGAGGMARGFKVAGWDTAWLCEIDPWLQDVLRARFPEAGVYGDVRQIDGAALTRAHGPIDLLAQGSPCQDLSVAGKRRGLKGARSSLFHEGLRVWQESGAPLMLWENVDGARSSNGGKDFGRILSLCVGAAVPVPRHPARTVTRTIHGIDPTGTHAATRRVAVPSANSRARKPWPRAGVVRGPAGVAAWRVLDGQYVPGASAEHTGGRAAPQRRTRVFVLLTRDPALDVERILHELDLDLDLDHPHGVADAAGEYPLDAGRGAGADGGSEVPPLDGGVSGDPHPCSSAGEDDPAGALGGAPGTGHPLAYGVTERTRAGLRQVEWQPGLAYALTAHGATGGRRQDGVVLDPGHPQHPQVIGFDLVQLTHKENRSTFAPGDPMPTLAVSGRPHVAITPPQTGLIGFYAEGGSQNMCVTDLSPTLKAPGADKSGSAHAAVCIPPAISFKPSHFTRAKDGAPSPVSHPLSHDADKGDQDAVVLAWGGERPAGAPEVADPLSANEGRTWTHEGTNNFRLHNVVTTRRGVVRRLTPTEACRLMAWPDWWLDVPCNGKPASDSRKYRATGNGVMSTVSEWIARRIDLHVTR